MVRIFLIIFYVFLSLIYTYIPYSFIDNSRWVIFTLIGVMFLKELDWFLIKQSCKNSKDKICSIFKQNKINKVKVKELKDLNEIKEK